MQKEKIVQFIRKKEYFPLTRDDLAKKMKTDEKHLSTFFSLIDDLCKEGELVEGKGRRLYRPETLNLVKAALRVTSRGFGFAENPDGDIFIPEQELHGAVDSDTVLVRIKKGSPTEEKKNREGSVAGVIARVRKTVVGTYIRERGYGLLLPDCDKLPQMTVENRFSRGALSGQKVAATFYEYDETEDRHYVKIKEILGFPDECGVDIASSVKEHGFAAEFSKKAMNEAEKCKNVSEEELSGRTDLTRSCIITIDGEDTKDIDDAVSVKRKGKGYLLGVHIADVGHYVKTGSALDKEALSRGTSVYPTGSVIPMLPTQLSNDLCSLNEGKIRPAISALIEFDKSGNVVKSTFCKSYIKNKRRMTYGEVYSVLTSDEESEKYEIPSTILKMLSVMYELYTKLKEKSARRGSIEFDFPEATAVLDKNGCPTDIVIRENTFANEIIEEFMIAANTEAAKFLQKNGTAALYRTHGKPNAEKMANVQKFMINSDLPKLNAPNEMLKAVRNTPLETIVSTMLLRSMAKACYSTQNNGHYGLALESYCHFTSPIRRYPDLFCHRVIKAILENDENAKKKAETAAEAVATACNERETAAALCERDILDMKKAEYMHSFIGNEFIGHISSVTSFGFFVMLTNTVEGLVCLEKLDDDYYVCNEENFTLTGKRRGRVFSVGDEVRVRLCSADKKTRRIDFELIEGGVKRGAKSKKKNHRAKQNRSSRVFHRRKGRGRH